MTHATAASIVMPTIRSRGENQPYCRRVDIAAAMAHTANAPTITRSVMRVACPAPAGDSIARSITQPHKIIVTGSSGIR